MKFAKKISKKIQNKSEQEENEMKFREDEDLRTEAVALLDYLERQGLDEHEALGTMGFAMLALFKDEADVMRFVKTLVVTFRAQQKGTADPGRANHRTGG